MSIDIPSGYTEVDAVPTNWGSCLELKFEWPADEEPITGATLTAIDCKPEALANMTFEITGPRTATGKLSSEHARHMAVGRRSYFRVSIVRPGTTCEDNLDRTWIEVK